MTYTFATLSVSPAAYEEIAKLLRAAGYHHAFGRPARENGAIDMHGIGLVKAESKPSEINVIAEQDAVQEDLAKILRDLGLGDHARPLSCREVVEREILPAIRELRAGLEESVKLQSHYACLLNQYDGGERKRFATAQEWIERLREVRKP